MSSIGRSLNKPYEDLWEMCLCNVAYFLKTHIKDFFKYFADHASQYIYLLISTNLMH